jgi:transposase
METPNPPVVALGLDIAKDKIDCALFLNGKFKTRVIANSPKGFAVLGEWLQKHELPQVHACCEATGTYWEAVAFWLIDQGHIVSVINPAQVHAYAECKLQRGKTDEQDARLIAQFCHLERPAAWQPPPPEERVLLALVRDLQVLQDMHRAEANRLLTAHDSVKPRIERHLDWLQTEIERLQKDIDQHIDQNPDLKKRRSLLDTIPGLGERTIPWLLAFLGDGKRFGNGKQAAAYVGLSPRLWQSGSSVRGKTRISKVGHSDLRRALYMPAMVSYSKLAAYRPFVQRLRAAGKAPKAIIVALMRKLVTIAQAVLKADAPFDAKKYQMACGG